ncbi:MAG: ABC transporter permease [Acidimicrobiales bacterium]
MAGAGWLIRRRIRRRWAAVATVAVIVAFGTTGALVALGAAERTANAYGRYLDRAGVGDVLINPSLLTADIDAAIRALPGVRSATSDAGFFTTIDEGEPRALHELDSGEITQVRGSVDGRYVAMDRPALDEGRMPTGNREALVSLEMARARGIETGDVVPVAFWSRADDVREGRDPARVASPVGVEHVTVVGIATLPDEVLPDNLYHRERMIVSPDVADRYDCLPDTPRREVAIDEAFSILAPEGCATLYQYYSLDVVGGDLGVPAALDSMERRAVELTAELPESVLDVGASYGLIATTTAHERERVERSVQPTVAALGALGVAAGAVTVVLAGLAVARELRRAEVEQSQWWQLGMSTIDRTTVVAAPLLAAAAAGVAVALVLAWWLSPIGPVGNVRSVVPSPARELYGWATLGSSVVAGLVGGGILTLTFASARRVGRARVRQLNVSTVRRLRPGWSRPEVAEGLRAAYGGRGSGLIVTGGAVAAAVFLTAVVFGTSLTTLVSSPASYGWTWDLGVIGNVGYGPFDLDAVEETLDRHDDVASWTGLGFTNAVSLDGELLLSMIQHEPASTADLAVVEGELPVGDDQVALGSRTASERGIGVGDEVDVAGGGVERRVATVSGLVAFPALGPFLADRASPGTGMLLPRAMFEAGVFAAPIGFVGIDLVGAASPPAVLATLRDELGSWDPTGYPTREYTAPVRPPEIDDATSIRTLPSFVGALLVLAAIVGLSFAVVMSVRGRRRDLAILRALGFTGWQIRQSVRVQTEATMIAALVVGVPLGTVVGRVAWRGFASQLGVVPDPSTPGFWILVTVAGGLLVALAAAAIPARLAARAAPAAVLHSE